MPVKDYNADPDLNTQISGINIAEGCAPSGINNAIRQLMADVKAEKDTQSAKDAAQDAAINAAKSSADKKVATVNGLTPDSNGNVDVGGMPLGTLMPYTGKDVPAGTLRADGTTYTDMRSSFPEFYEWVANSGLTVPIADYALVEGSCGYYGLDANTGTVRMPTLAAGVFGTTVAGKYGQAMQAGLPNISGQFSQNRFGASGVNATGPFSAVTHRNAGGPAGDSSVSDIGLTFDASKANPIYGRSDTVTPSHVKYPWVIVVYNAAVPPSVAQAGEFIEMLDKLATALPTGTVVSHAGNKDLNGYLLCNGAAVSRTTYAKLFEAIGTTYGEGDGSSTFNLPNLTDRFIQGSGTAGTVHEAGLPNIKGGARFSKIFTFNNGFSGALYFDTEKKPYTTGSEETTSYTYLRIDASKSSSIYGKSNTVQPPALTMRYYIKY